MRVKNVNSFVNGDKHQRLNLAVGKFNLYGLEDGTHISDRQYYFAQRSWPIDNRCERIEWNATDLDMDYRTGRYVPDED